MQEQNKKNQMHKVEQEKERGGVAETKVFCTDPKRGTGEVAMQWNAQKHQTQNEVLAQTQNEVLTRPTLAEPKVVKAHG